MISERLGMLNTRRGAHIADSGIVRLYSAPGDASEQDLNAWWPRLTLDDKHKLLVPFQIPLYDRRGEWQGEYEWVVETSNLFTNLGVTSMLNFWCFGNTSQIHAFQQILSVGNGACSGINRTDTGVIGDAFASGARHAWTTFSNAGFVGVHSALFANGDAVGDWTNGGAYGYDYTGSHDATTSAGTGQLNTHFLIVFHKDNSHSYTLDYSVTLSN